MWSPTVRKIVHTWKPFKGAGPPSETKTTTEGLKKKETEVMKKSHRAAQCESTATLQP